MTGVEAFVLFRAGHISGLSIASGFLFQAIRRVNQPTWSKVMELVWGVTAAANAIIGGLMPIFLIGIVVVGEEPQRPSFWPRAALFTAGLVAGGALVFFGFSQISKGARGARE